MNQIQNASVFPLAELKNQATVPAAYFPSLCYISPEPGDTAVSIYFTLGGQVSVNFDKPWKHISGTCQQSDLDHL